MGTFAIVARLLGLMASPALAARLDLARGAAAETAGIALSVMGPYFLKLLVDGLTTGTVPPAQLVAYVAAFAVSWAGTSTMASLKQVYTTRINDSLTRTLLADALRSQLPALASEKTGDSGRILGLVERLPFSLQVVAGGLIWQAGPMLINVAVSLAVIALLVPLKYVGVMAVILVCYAGAVHAGAGRYQVRARDANLATAGVSQAAGDVLRNARRVVVNGATDAELAFVAERAMAKRQANLKLSWSLVRLSAFQYAVVGGGLVVLLALAGLDVNAGAMTVGDFVLLQAYALRLAAPLSGFGFMMRQAGVALANVKDVFDLIRPPRAEARAAPAPPGPAVIGLDAVSFSYGKGLGGVRAVTADIPAGAFAVIVGPNGSGKSTLAQLVAGLLEPDSGAVRIGGTDLATIPRAERHRHVLYVPQTIGLFNRTLRDNALYPPTGRSEGELARTLAEWRFHDDGRDVDFDLLVGEQGERLSGGQVQKLELARLLGVDVPAVILDETTSALDARSEHGAIAALRESFPNGATLVMVSHRIAFAEAADLVLHMEGGRLAGTGRHDDLLRGDVYRALWAMLEDGER